VTRFLVFPNFVQFTNYMLRSLLALCVLVVFSSLNLSAQEATIVGTVTDPSGAAVPNVAITVTNTETGQNSHFTSGNVGQYVAPRLTIGRYNVSGRRELQGRAATKHVLGVDDRRRVDFAWNWAAHNRVSR